MHKTSPTRERLEGNVRRERLTREPSSERIRPLVFAEVMFSWQRENVLAAAFAIPGDEK